MNDDVKEILKKYDLVVDEETIQIPKIPKKGLIAIIGSSGSGKSTILRDIYGDSIDDTITYPNKPLLSLFSSAKKGEELLIACGLRSIPTWKREITTLSNGEKHRAEIALGIDNGKDYIDEFTSVVDRDTAKSLSVALSKYFVRSNKEKLIIATCHRDIVEWLQPDHVYDTDLREWLPRGSLRQRPKIELKVRSCDSQKVWEIFRKHHYLSSDINKSCNSFVATYNNNPIAMTSIISQPGGNIKNGWRGHRTVVLPEWQGMGIGVKLSDLIAEYVTSSGCVFYSKTSHPSMGIHRENSPNWEATSYNKKNRPDYIDRMDSLTKSEYGHTDELLKTHSDRVCYCHKFIGKPRVFKDKLDYLEELFI
tara:strand:+ start:2245 stop:3339 length:1095 start_codon:yes stop_codon:yes gene_type:complete